jgi:hypothetical protein
LIWSHLLLRNVRSALDRGLPTLAGCRAHGATLSVAAGGPSLADTYQHLTGQIAAVNGSCGWLIDHGVIPNLCGVLDPGEHMADVIRADRRVRYYVASVCDPSVFDKLRDCHVTLWHATGFPGTAETIPPNSLLIGTGCTMGLRWLTLGYALGFRRFDFHGLDSSFRDGETHAYKDHGNRPEDVITVHGRKTRTNYTEQVTDFFDALERAKMPDIEPLEIQIHGDGLLQDECDRRLGSRIFRNAA